MVRHSGYIGDQAFYQMLRSIWSSIEHMENTLPPSAYTIFVGVLCYFLFWLITISSPYLSASSLRWFLFVKSITMMVAGVALFVLDRRYIYGQSFGSLFSNPTKMVDGSTFATVFFYRYYFGPRPCRDVPSEHICFRLFLTKPKDAIWATFWFLPIACHPHCIRWSHSHIRLRNHLRGRSMEPSPRRR